MKKPFTKAASLQTPDIVTKAELLQRLRNRPKPSMQMHLTPSGSVKTAVHKHLDHLEENRIDHLQKKLGNATTKLRQGVSYAQTKGRARADFGRVR